MAAGETKPLEENLDKPKSGEAKPLEENFDKLKTKIIKNAQDNVWGPKLPMAEMPIKATKDGKPLPPKEDPLNPALMSNASKLLEEGLTQGYKEFEAKNFDGAAVEWSKALMCIDHIRKLNDGKLAQEEQWRGEGQDGGENLPEVDGPIEEFEEEEEEEEEKELPEPRTITEELSRELDEYWFKLNANMAMVSLKLRNYREALRHSDEVLKKQKKNNKALFRKGSALIGLRRFDEAVKVLEYSLEVEPDNAATKALLQEARHKEDGAKKKLKETRKKMMDFRCWDPDARIPPSLWKKIKTFIINSPEEVPRLVKKWGWVSTKFGIHATWSIWLGLFVYYFGTKSRDE